jgi:hypothetical protein
MQFILKIRAHVLTHNRKIRIDFSATESMVVCGTLRFFAELNLIKKEKRSLNLIACTYPKNNRVAQVLQHLGILKMLNCNCSITPDRDDVINWKNRPIHSNGEHSMLIDMNGDGLLDRVFDRNPTNDQQGLYVYLNTGHSFDSGKQWQTNLGGDLNWKNHPIHSYGYNGKHSMLIDMNGDSLPDRVFDRNPANDQQGFYVYLNTGHGFDSGKQWQSDLGHWKNHPTHENGENSIKPSPFISISIEYSPLL